MKDRTRIGRRLAPARGPSSETGFTLIELIVVVTIIGIMAAIAVPAYFQTVEQNHAQEAVEALSVLNSAQARYYQKYGAYCYTLGFGCGGFDVPAPVLKYFQDPNLQTPAPGAAAPSWKITLTRNVATQPYGQYTILYDAEPGGVTYTCTPGGGGRPCQVIMPLP